MTTTGCCVVRASLPLIKEEDVIVRQKRRMRSKPNLPLGKRGKTSNALPTYQDVGVLPSDMVKQPILLSDVAYIENDAWWGWAFAPGGFVLGPSILFALYILGTLAFDLVAKKTKKKEGEEKEE